MDFRGGFVGISCYGLAPPSVVCDNVHISAYSHLQVTHWLLLIGLLMKNDTWRITDIQIRIVECWQSVASTTDTNSCVDNYISSGLMSCETHILPGSQAKSIH